MELPIGNIKFYLLEHLLDTNSWLKTHTKHGWAEHERILESAKLKLKGSCYEGKDPKQYVFLQVLEDGAVNLLGAMILGKDKVLLDNMIIFAKNDEIRAFVEDENDEITTYYFYGEWKTKKKKPHRSNTHELYVLDIKHKAAQRINEIEADRADLQRRRNQLEDSGIHFAPSEENEHSKI